MSVLAIILFFKVHISVIIMFFKSALPFVQLLQMTVLYLVQIAIFPFREKEILFAFQTAILVGVLLSKLEML